MTILGLVHSGRRAPPSPKPFRRVDRESSMMPLDNWLSHNRIPMIQVDTKLQTQYSVNQPDYENKNYSLKRDSILKNE